MSICNNILDVLISRLSGKGVMPVEMPGLLRDVRNIISSREGVTVEDIDLRLAMLGWPEDTVDEFIFEIMKRLIEDVGSEMPPDLCAYAGRGQ